MFDLTKICKADRSLFNTIVAAERAKHDRIRAAAFDETSKMIVSLGAAALPGAIAISAPLPDLKSQIEAAYALLAENTGSHVAEIKDVALPRVDGESKNRSDFHVGPRPPAGTFPFSDITMEFTSALCNHRSATVPAARKLAPEPAAALAELAAAGLVTVKAKPTETVYRWDRKQIEPLYRKWDDHPANEWMQHVETPQWLDDFARLAK